MSELPAPGAKPNRHNRRAAKVAATHGIDLPLGDSRP